MDRDALGRYGEDVAARHAASQGLRILERRWRSSHGEIDLVAVERGEIVFIEVKTRRGAAFGMPEDAVTRRKRARLRALAEAYLAAKGLRGRPYRIDIIAVTAPAAGAPAIAHFRSAVAETD